MNVLFVTLTYPKRGDSNIYSDLLEHFKDAGDTVCVVAPEERRNGADTSFYSDNGIQVLRVKTPNVTGSVGLVEKGYATLRVESLFDKAIKRYYPKTEFDLLLYSTPPITFENLIAKLKKRHSATTMLLLRDIFPQNAVDIGLLRCGGALHGYFRKREKRLYGVSDHIGCMTEGNVRYLLDHNPGIDSSKVFVSPNCINPSTTVLNRADKNEIRKSLGIPSDAIVFVYGGNMGKPQGIPFLVECLRAIANRNDVYFLLCGNGSEREQIERFIEAEKPLNIRYIPGLPKDEYERMIQACDIGLLFLDYRFTIPNYPSRSLSYMDKMMPILACTDRNTDVGAIIDEGGFGWWCPSNDVAAFVGKVNEAISSDIPKMGENAKKYLLANYSASQWHQGIVSRIQREF